MMPDHPIWATGNDDTHGLGEIGYSYQILLNRDSLLDNTTIKNTLTSGQFYVCHDKSRSGENVVLLDSLTTNDNSITVNANCADSMVTWISEGEIVHKGKVLPIDGTQGNRIKNRLYQ